MAEEAQKCWMVPKDAAARLMVSNTVLYALMKKKPALTRKASEHQMECDFNAVCKEFKKHRDPKSWPPLPAVDESKVRRWEKVTTISEMSGLARSAITDTVITHSIMRKMRGSSPVVDMDAFLAKCEPAISQKVQRYIKTKEECMNQSSSSESESGSGSESESEARESVTPPSIERNFRYMAYARVSTCAESNYLNAQLNHLKASRPGCLQVTDVSSAFTMSRPGLCGLLDKAEQGLIDNVIVTSEDRLAADEFMAYIRNKLLEKGVNVIVVAGLAVPPSARTELQDDAKALYRKYCPSKGTSKKRKRETEP